MTFSHAFGQNDQGICWLKGSETTSVLTTMVHEVIGNADVGTFEQTGGTPNADHLSLAWNGDAFFNHTGGSRLEVRLDLSTDKTCYGINVFNSVAGLSGDADCSVGALVGDVNNNGVVNSIDMGAVKFNIGQSPASPGKARFDVNRNGAINSIDMGAVKQFIPNAASCP